MSKAASELDSAGGVSASQLMNNENSHMYDQAATDDMEVKLLHV